MFKLELKPQEHLHTKFGNVSINKYDGYYRVTSRKEGNYFERWHRLIFEDFYGFIPKGYHVHHKDGDKRNNCIMNLQILTPSNHATNHQLDNGANKTGYYRVQKWKDERYKQDFVWVYQAKNYKDKNGNKIRKVITSVSLDKLEEKVIAKGLPWYKLGGK